MYVTSRITNYSYGADLNRANRGQLTEEQYEAQLIANQSLTENQRFLLLEDFKVSKGGGSKRHKLDVLQRIDIYEAHQHGMAMNQLARKYQVSGSTISNAIQLENIRRINPKSLAISDAMLREQGRL